jgi:hypothetical protein
MKNPLLYLILGWVWLFVSAIISIWTPVSSYFGIVSALFFAVSIILSHVNNKISPTLTEWIGYLLLFGGYFLGKFTEDKVMLTISALVCIVGLLFVVLGEKYLDHRREKKREACLKWVNTIDEEFRLPKDKQLTIEYPHYLFINGDYSSSLEIDGNGYILSKGGRRTLYRVSFDWLEVYFRDEEVGVLEDCRGWASPWLIIHLE